MTLEDIAWEAHCALVDLTEALKDTRPPGPECMDEVLKIVRDLEGDLIAISKEAWRIREGEE